MSLDKLIWVFIAFTLNTAVALLACAALGLPNVEGKWSTTLYFADASAAILLLFAVYKALRSARPSRITLAIFVYATVRLLLFAMQYSAIRGSQLGPLGDYGRISIIAGWLFCIVALLLAILFRKAIGHAE
jgi:uncharacterized membrane protein (DUF2068 family)